MNILPITSPQFAKYGRVLKFKGGKELLKAMEKTICLTPLNITGRAR